MLEESGSPRSADSCLWVKFVAAAATVEHEMGGSGRSGTCRASEDGVEWTNERASGGETDERYVCCCAVESRVSLETVRTTKDGDPHRW